MYDLLISPFIDYPFMRRALFGAIFLALTAAPLGVFLHLRRLSLVADSMSHAILPGVALGFLWASGSITALLIGGIVTGLLVALSAGVVARYTALKEDASFAAFYLISLGLGVLLISFKGTNVDLLHILFGSVLSLSDQALMLTMLISSISLIVLAFIYRPLVMDSFDPMFLRVESRHTYVHFIFLTLLVVNLVSGFQILGTLMVVGIMLLPAITARFLGRTLGAQLVIAVCVGCICVYFGLVLSFGFDLPPSSTIILLNGLVYVLALMCGKNGGLLRRYCA